MNKTVGQYFAALTNMRSGVMGDERTYDYAIALRAVNTIDFMTAESAEVLQCCRRLLAGLLMKLVMLTG